MHAMFAGPLHFWSVSSHLYGCFWVVIRFSGLCLCNSCLCVKTVPGEQLTEERSRAPPPPWAHHAFLGTLGLLASTQGRVPVKGSSAEGSRKIKAQIVRFWAQLEEFVLLSFGSLPRSSLLRVPDGAPSWPPLSFGALLGSFLGAPLGSSLGSSSGFSLGLSLLTVT